MLITDQVAIAPCTDSIQVRISTFEAKQLDDLTRLCTKSELYTRCCGFAA